MISELTSLCLLAALALTTAAYVFMHRGRERSLPPGPPGYPIIGNLFSMPDIFDAQSFIELGKQYGTDILHFGGLGNHVIILNSYKAAQDLLEKRSGIYSGRPHSVMIHELSGWGFQFVLKQYGESWRVSRKLFTRHFNFPEIYQPREVWYVHRLLRQLLQDPDDFFTAVKNVPASISVDMTYGIKVKSNDDYYLKIIAEGFESAGVILGGLYMVNLIPALKYLPRWFPGAGFQTEAAAAKALAQEVLEKPFAASKDQLRSGSYERSFVTNCLEDTQISESALEEELIKLVAGQVYIAASDTSASALSTFFLAMVMHPHVQKKAQEELDRVLQGRLPDHQDLSSLPYISAVVLEVLRWRPVAPIGIPHSNISDDVYQGFHFPAGSTVIANQRAMLSDEEVYPEPDIFKPARFLKDGKLDTSIRNPMDIAFGFGRRTCPGRHIAQSLITLTAASVLSVFDLLQPTDEFGKSIELKGDYIDTVVSKPREFPCTIKPRSPHALSLIRSLEED